MAELQFEAPLAKCENEEWTDYNDFQKAKDEDQTKPDSPRAHNPLLNGSSEHFEDTFSGSLEDLVNSFDENITNCFKNFGENVENIAPVQIRSQEEIMNNCQ